MAWTPPAPSGTQFVAPQHGLDVLFARLDAIELSVRNLANPPLLLTLKAMVDDLAAQDVILATQDAEILAQQAALTAANVTLSAAVANIATLVGQQTVGDALNASQNPTITTTPTVYAVCTFTVPAGYTKAHVIAVSAMANGSPPATNLRTRIAGSDGLDMYSFYGNSASSFARPPFTVTPGGTFQVSSIASTLSSSVAAVITTSATVTYYR